MWELIAKQYYPMEWASGVSWLESGTSPCDGKRLHPEAE